MGIWMKWRLNVNLCLLLRVMRNRTDMKGKELRTYRLTRNRYPDRWDQQWRNRNKAVEQDHWHMSDRVVALEKQAYIGQVMKQSSEAKLPVEPKSATVAQARRTLQRIAKIIVTARTVGLKPFILQGNAQRDSSKIELKQVKMS